MSEPSRSEQVGSDRVAFLARIRSRQGPPPPGGPHPPPPPPDVVPEMQYRNLDGITTQSGLIDVFKAAVITAEATADVVDESRLDAALTAMVAEHVISTAVVSREPEAIAIGERLTTLGVKVEAYSAATAATSDLGITSATQAIAATGSVVVDSATSGSRAVSLLPRVHLCVLPAERIVASPADVLRHPDAGGMPSCRVVITGPSRTGDIEQLLTLGAHGPVAMHVVVLTE